MSDREGGFGSGLRAKLAKEEEPRSPAEAIAAVVDSPDVDLLRSELDASLSREQDLRYSLNEQVVQALRTVEHLT